MTRGLSHRPPSAVWRAILSLTLLLGFYALLLGLAAVLFWIPLAVVHYLGFFHYGVLFLFGAAWVPAFLLAKSAFTTRLEEPVLPSRRLLPQEAPSLFAAVDELARRAGTAPPTEIYLDYLPELAVMDLGGLFRTRRVMILGAPLFELLSVDELRAGIAHELGHFIGGDTRLATFSVRTHALFASVLSSVARDPFRVRTRHFALELGFEFAHAIGRGVVRHYGALFLRTTRRISRRQELAADELSALLVSPATARRALDKFAIGAPAYRIYLTSEVALAVANGAMPSDLTAGFRCLLERLPSSAKGRQFMEQIRTRPTDPFDTHPALVERLRSLEVAASGGEAPDERSASVLLADRAALDAWVVAAVRERVASAMVANGVKIGSLRELPWRTICQEIYAPAAREAARRAAERLHTLFPSAATLRAMFATTWRSVEAGQGLSLARHMNPKLERAGANLEALAFEECRRLVGVLFQGALLEHGAVVEESIGCSMLMFDADGERVDAGDLCEGLGAENAAARAALTRWADRFEPDAAISARS